MLPASILAEYNPRLAGMGRGHFEADFVANAEADETLAHLAGDLGDDLLSARQGHAEHHARQDQGDLPDQFIRIFLHDSLQKTSWTSRCANSYTATNDMKNSPITSILLAVLAISAVWSVILCVQFLNNSRAIRRLQTRVANIQSRQSAFQFLVGDVADYAKTHPQMDPILDSIGYKRNATAAPAAPKK